MSAAETDGRHARARDLRRQELVVAAFNEIAERGFEGLRTREVAAEAGVNVATLHYYFPTKEALIRAVVERSMERFRTTLASEGSPSEQLRVHLHAVRELLRAEPRLGIVMGELALRSARDPAIAQILEETHATWHRTVRAMLRRAARDGHVAPDVDSDDVASVVVATLMSMTLPVPGGEGRAEQAVRQLERWLGLSTSADSEAGTSQATD